MDALIRRARWYGARASEALGRLGKLALAVALVALVVSLTQVMPAYRALESERAELEAALQDGSRMSLQQVKADTASALTGFYGKFPSLGADLDLLEGIFQAARETGVELEKANYELMDQGPYPLVRYRVDVPVRADYLQTRAFLQRVLEDMPNVALEQVSFRRSESDGRIQSVLSLSLYLRRQ